MSELSAPSTPHTKGKGKTAVQLSDESDAPTHRARAAKNDNDFSPNNFKKPYV